MTLLPFVRGIDYSGARPDLAEAKSGGAAFIVRYSAGAGMKGATGFLKSKLITKPEFDAILAAGMDIVANSEWYESRVTEGAIAGATDGKADLAFWRALGYRRGAVIIVSWDEGQPNTSKHPGLLAYLTAYRKALGGYYTLGLYAGDVAISAMLAAGAIDYGWRAMSESWSGPTGSNSNYKPGSAWLAKAKAVASKSRAHMWQNGNRWFGENADENVILRAGLPTHLSGATAPAKPVVKPPAKPAPAKPAPKPTTPRTYKVVGGDTLGKIADRFGTSVSAIISRNRAKYPTIGTGPDDHVEAGWTLTLTGNAPAAKPSAAKTKAYTIRSGDNFWVLEDRYKWAHGTLQKLNPSANATNLQIGQSIRVPA